MSNGATSGQFAPGTVIGTFTVVRLLGAGGMGEVYLVRRHNIDRLDALKVLNERADSEIARRFLREMQLASRLQHPHIVTVHDVGHAEMRPEPDGAVVLKPWILMQYVDGRTLAQELRDVAPMPLSVERSLALLEQIADGLAAAHGLGIVHRDVKPDNVLIHHGPSGREHAYVADLGIAEALNASTRLTGLQGNLGTPGYMSPERYYGSTELDARADVYSLACMAFEMLSGKLPRDVSPGFSSIPALSKVREGLGRDADAVLKRGLAHDPEDRYDSCPALVTALRQALTTGPHAAPAAAPPAASTAPAAPPTALPQPVSQAGQPGWQPFTAPGGLPSTPAPGPTSPLPQGRRRRGALVGGSVAGVLLVLLLGGAVLARELGGEESRQTRSASGDEPATTPSPSESPPAEPTTEAAPPEQQPAPLGDVLDQPAGLFCRDLQATGYSYSAAVDYWRHNGQPDQMDADLNGIPCETVYPAASVISYFRETAAPETDLPSGLLCQDLAQQGLSYPFAVAYWFAEGLPDRMDADLNGIPCETVYPFADVEEFWS